ncbi:MAG: UDP-N-acetylmuramoyl-tripeptide--D-alanyl-D-alanine ligase [Oscillospiraceae bacterium]|jgi:UDP-N-acetylmuramoyl-tripeptide--D-alanyl-D-alanine ligase|nr:UDP-N-acetylmuramoyl-tripeptide--D-alanyl-D-alanine ligase [Oscillospiraceae bacterium]
MKSISIKKIIDVTEGKLFSEETAAAITSISVDSRKIGKGALFIPICGTKMDGHDFIEQAFSAGATAALTQKSDYLPTGKILIQVDNTLDALQKIAADYRKNFSIPIIGITGSVGKTSTKEMIASVLSIKFCVAKTKGNFNGQIGLPLSIFEIEQKHQVAVIEMGISEFGEMSKLSKIALPTKAVITNMGISHIANLKSQENICKEKLHILDEFENHVSEKEKGQTVFLNADDPLLMHFAEDISCPKIRFGFAKNADFRASDISFNENSTHFNLTHKGVKKEMKIPVLGKHNVYGALAAIAVGFDFGLSLEEIKSGLSNYSGIAMRQQIHKIKGLTIIDDSYNSSPDSMRSAVKLLEQFKEKARKIAILGDMLELGERAQEEHYKLGKFLSKKINILLTIGSLAKYIAKGAKDNNSYIKVHSHSTKQETIFWLKKYLLKDDVILIKGSRGMHLEEVVKALFA